MSHTINPKYFEKILANLPGHVYWKDKDGAFLGCNFQQAIDAGFDHPNELVGKTDYDMPWRKQAPYLREIDLQVMRTGNSITTEELSEIYGGTKKIYLSNKMPLYDENDEIAGVLGISIDITERKKLEDDLIKAKKLAETANKAKTEFLENMRHDLRTPLTGIVGFAKIIKDEATNPLVKEYAENLVESSHTLLELLNEILEGIKVFTAEMPIARRKFNLKKLTQKVIDLFTPKAIEKGLDISLNIDTNLPSFVVGDPMRIQGVLIELVSNAINFTEKGGITIDVELMRQDQKEMIILIKVEDTGIGIPEDKQEEVFLRFKRLVPSYKGLYKGTGLGLAIVKQFIDDLKGEVYCKGSISEGTVFSCLIPLQESLINDDSGAINLDTIIDEEKIKSLYSRAPASFKQEGDKTKVLIVEDQLLAAKVAQSIITKLDCNVDVASDGKTAMKYFQNTNYDLIFMDVGLPDTSGIELTKQIRAKEWELGEHVPIVALTAHIDIENKQECIHSGMDAVLSKPLMQNTAENILNAFVPSRKSSTEEAIADDKERLLNLSGKVLDVEEGIAKMGGNVEAANEMITLLKSHIEEEFPKLLSAKTNNDWHEIQSITHKLRGGCAYCGAQRLKQACANLENYLHAKKTQFLEELFLQLVTEMNNLLNESR